MTQDLEEAIRENAGWLESISAERIRDEFEKILRLGERGVRSEDAGAPRAHALRRARVHGDGRRRAGGRVPPQGRLRAHPDRGPSVEADPILRKAAFFHDIGKPRTLVYEHRCTYCGAKSTMKSAEEGECERCGGRTIPKKIHFYGHENVGAAIARRAMHRLAYPRTT